VIASLRIVAKVRHELGIRTFSPMNVFLSDGNDLVAACYTFGLGNYEGLGNDYHPPDESVLRIWYTMGKSYGYYDGEWRMEHAGAEATSCILASEPLTRDQSTWNAVPLQHLVYVRRAGSRPSVELVPLAIE
jgi:glutamine amidotransferase